MIDNKTKQILRHQLIDYMEDNNLSAADFKKGGKATFPVSITLVRDLLYTQKRKAAWKPRSQYLVLKFFGIEHNFDFVDGNYIIKEQKVRHEEPTD